MATLPRSVKIFRIANDGNYHEHNIPLEESSAKANYKLGSHIARLAKRREIENRDKYVLASIRLTNGRAIVV